MEGCGDEATDKVGVWRRPVYPVPEANQLIVRLEDSTEKDDERREKRRQGGRRLRIGRQRSYSLSECRDPHLEEHEHEPHVESPRPLICCFGPIVVEVHGVEPWKKKEGASNDVVRYFGEEGGEDESSPVIYF